MSQLYVVFSTKKEREKMWDFLQSCNLDLLAKTEETCDTGPILGEDMGIPGWLGKQSIGFEGEWFGQKTWMLAAWMAVKSTQKIINDWSFIKLNDEEIIVIIGDKPIEKHALMVNEKGFLNSWIERDLPIGPDMNSQKEFLEGMELKWVNRLSNKRKKNIKTS